MEKKRPVNIMLVFNSEEALRTSRIIVKWLTEKAQTIQASSPKTGFAKLRRVFLYGDTIKESMAYVLMHEEITKKEKGQLGFTIEQPKGRGSFSHSGDECTYLTEAFISPSAEYLAMASEELKKLNLDETFATNNIYLECPNTSQKEYMGFVLGE